jgi:tRNA-Thr(GGU) m(6)t(6)A37 methyltransferase TsaA
MVAPKRLRERFDMGADAIDMRPGEEAARTPPAFDDGLWFIGTIATPWRERSECPRRGDHVTGPVCRVSVFEPWTPALKGIEEHTHLQILYFMHLSRRDLVRQRPHNRGEPIGTFAIRSPVRPNPVASALVALVGVEGAILHVRGLDCVDGTPLIDVKPEHCPRA